MILQHERSECSLACVAMVASSLGLDWSLGALRRAFPISARGATLGDVRRVLSGTGIDASPLRLELDQLPALRLPLIVHWNFDHYVVLTGIRRGRYVVHDPARGVRHLSEQEFGESFTGVVLACERFGADAASPKRRDLTLWKLFPNDRSIWRGLALVAAVTLALQIAIVAMPMLVQIAVDSLAGHASLGLLAAIAGGVVSITLYQVVVSSMRSLAIADLNARLGDDMGGNLFRHMLALPLSFFEQRHTGDLVSKFGSLEAVRILFAAGLLETLLDSLTVVVLLVTLLVYAPAAAAICALSAVGFVTVRQVSLARSRYLVEEGVAAKAAEETVFIETVRGVASIKGMGGEAERYGTWIRNYRRFLNASLRASRLSTILEGVRGLLPGLEIAALLIVFGLMYREQAISIGMIFAVLAYRQRFSEQVLRLIDRVFQLRTMDIHIGRIADILGQDAEAIEALPATDEPTGLVVRDLEFLFQGEAHPLLAGVNIAVEPGTFVAICGESGVGKTTFLKILSGLLRPTRGTVSIAGHEVHAQGVRRLLPRSAIVLQEDQLFSGSILENITFFDASPDFARARSAARVAQIEAHICAMPLQWDTAVGDNGTTLSGGQRQRLLLARALYRSPVLLFLDEATSHLDVDTERKVLSGIRALGITTIMIAHRPEAMRIADRVVSLVGGRLREARADAAAAIAGPLPAAKHG